MWTSTRFMAYTAWPEFSADLVHEFMADVGGDPDEYGLDRADLGSMTDEQAGSALHKDNIVGSMYLLNARPEFKVLGLDEVGRDRNFFDLGGHSLAVVQVQRRLREATGRELAVADMFRHTTVRALARHLAAQEGGAPQAVAQLDERPRPERRAHERRVEADALVDMVGVGRIVGAAGSSHSFSSLRNTATVPDRQTM